MDSTREFLFAHLVAHEGDVMTVEITSRRRVHYGGTDTDRNLVHLLAPLKSSLRARTYTFADCNGNLKRSSCTVLRRSVHLHQTGNSDLSLRARQAMPVCSRSPQNTLHFALIPGVKCNFIALSVSHRSTIIIIRPRRSYTYG